jgi:hypothetical protein
VRESLGSGFNVVFGIQYDLTPIFTIEAFLSANNFGDETVSLPVSTSPGASAVPADVFLRMTMQLATANLVMQRIGGKIAPYGLVGMGVYHRSAQVTTNAVGFVTGFCDPFWFICTPTPVPVETIEGERTSTDFGMVVGGGLKFWYLFAEARYHYVWGPTIAAEVNPLSDPPSSPKANGQFMTATVGVRF